MPSLEEIRKRFQRDRFAMEALGAEIREAEQGRAVCVLRLLPRHRNANDAPMGGAVFTLADFTFAVAANGFSEKAVVSQHVSMTFLAPAKGSELTAEARCRKAGRRTCLYEVEIRDELGTFVALAVMNGFICD